MGNGDVSGGENSGNKKFNFDSEEDIFRHISENYGGPKGLDSLFGKETVKTVSPSLTQLGEVFKGVTANAGSQLGNLSTVVTGLYDEAQKVSNEFGIAKGRTEEFVQIVADASPELIKMGLNASDVASNYGKMSESLGSAASLGVEAITEMSAAAKITGQDVGTLTAKFREVGVSVYDAGDRMKEVANYARNVGVSVSAVSDGVLKNLNKLNTMNFQGGVEGLTRMAAQAARLGVDMNKVFLKADELMDPEKAIDMSAALQRLGVTSSALLDPLSAMSMAQNDPEELQKQMINISKEFTKFNEQSGKFEILPGAKRRLKEVAGALGMTADELAKMSIQSSEFDKKLSQIKMPSFAEGDKETKELIAGMAQMKGGVATINVKDEKTGEVKLKQVDQLTPEDIEKLKESQTEQAKSVEELAYDQLTQLQQINAGINGVQAATVMGAATSEPIEKLYGTMLSGQRQIAQDYAGRTKTEDMRGYTDQLSQPLEDFIKATAEQNQEAQKQSLETLVQNLSNIEQKVIKNQTDYITESATNLSNIFKESYGKKTENKEPIKTEATVNLNMNVTGDANVKDMDLNKVQDKIVNYLTQTAEGRDLLKQAVEGKNTPQSNQGTKNQ